MIETSKPHATLMYVMNYLDIDKRVRYGQAAAEDAFKGMVNGQSQQTNLLDDDDPAQPRIFFQSETKNIAISQLACQLSLNFERAGIPFFDQLEIARKNIKLFAQGALKFKPKFRGHGFVIDLRYPSPQSTIQVAEFVHSKFLKNAPIGGPLSAVLQMGYRYNDVNLNFVVNPYESRKIPESANGYVRADMLPVTETGLQVRLDANSFVVAERFDHSVLPDYLVATVAKFMDEQFEELTGLPKP